MEVWTVIAPGRMPLPVMATELEVIAPVVTSPPPVTLTASGAVMLPVLTVSTAVMVTSEVAGPPLKPAVMAALPSRSSPALRMTLPNARTWPLMVRSEPLGVETSILPVPLPAARVLRPTIDPTVPMVSAPSPGRTMSPCATLIASVPTRNLPPLVTTALLLKVCAAIPSAARAAPSRPTSLLKITEPVGLETASPTTLLPCELIFS